MRTASGWTNKQDYARFLALQFAARRPVESWLSDQAPADICPPMQCQLIADDLADLRASEPEQAVEFELNTDGPDTDDEASVLGVAWVLAGSGLGNRAILHDMRRNGHDDWPHAFLGDDAMPAFWNKLRPQIEIPVDQDVLAPATKAALATFAHFIDVADTATGKTARANDESKWPEDVPTVDVEPGSTPVTDHLEPADTNNRAIKKAPL